MKKVLMNKIPTLNDHYVKLVIVFWLLLMLIFISNHVFATDLLAGTDENIKDTIQGTAKKWLLWIDGGISLSSFLYTKKPVVFFSVLGICLFITALVHLAGS